jgi:hypothetical protein
MRGIVLIGGMLALVGLIAFAIPTFTTPETQDVVKLGDLKVQAKTEQLRRNSLTRSLPLLAEGRWYSESF